jgi:hypothetical protein
VTDNPIDVVLDAAGQLADLLEAEIEEASPVVKAQLLERVNEIRGAMDAMRL